jgi:basic membrane protein A
MVVKKMKKFFSFTLCGLLLMSTLVGCGNNSSNSNPSNTATANLKVGMVTDAGTIDDKSFNQGTWEGITEAAQDLGITEKYLKPNGTTEFEYLTEINNLYDAGFKFIVTPGYKFETAIFKIQDELTDAKFILLDGTPNNGDFDNYETKVGENSVSVLFAEHESGFIGAIAAALEIGEGEFGFIGGMEIPSVQKFNWGFQQGIQYANENLGTNITLKEDNVIYQGSFDNVPAGQQLAAQMYDKGVDVIFVAAGGVGAGVITEAKERAGKGEKVWVLGVDVDQYEEGIYDPNTGASAILTSATKKIAKATYDLIQAELNGTFPGGEILMFDAKNDGVGIPSENPNLSEQTETTVAEIFEKLKSGEITVSSEKIEGLIN